MASGEAAVIGLSGSMAGMSIARVEPRVQRLLYPFGVRAAFFIFIVRCL